MLDSKFNVVYTGLQEGVTAEDFTSRFCSKFGISEQKAQQIVNSSSDVVVKKELDENKAEKYRSAFESCGMTIRVDEIPAQPEAGSGLSLEPISDDSNNSETNATNAVPTVNSAKPQCPKCGSEQVEGDECQACGIYISKYMQTQRNTTIAHDDASVVAHDTSIKNERLHTESDDDEPTQQFDPQTAANPYETPEAELSTAADYDLEPEKVSPGSGFQWLKEGFWHFKQNPLAWIGAIVVFFIVLMIVAFIPFVGMLLINLFSPVIMAGFILGAHEQYEGGDFRVSHLFAGFSSNVGQLVLVGVIYMLGFLLIGVAFGALIGGIFMTSGMAQGMADPNMDPSALMGLMGPGMMIMMLLAFALSLLLLMAYYYAPALVALNELSAVQAMKLSLKACLKNWLAFLVYGLLVMVLFMVAAIPVFLGYLIAIPMLQASIYTSYRDIFRHS